QLHAELGDVADLAPDALQDRRIDPVALVAGERFARKLQDDAAVRRGRGTGTRRHAHRSPIWQRANRLTTTRSCVFALTVSTRSFTFDLPDASLMSGCSSKHWSATTFSSLPSTILSSTCGGFF